MSLAATVSAEGKAERPLSVRGPARLDRAGDPPSFEVSSPLRYRVLEVATAPELFDWDSRRHEWNEKNFYATWLDNAVGRFETSEFSLPAGPWKELRRADRLYYRVGSTDSADPDQWAGYIVSTYDDDIDVPFIEITGTVHSPAEEVVASELMVQGPASLDRDGPPPRFEFTGAMRYHVLEITTESELFDAAIHGGERNADNFYTSWDDPAVGRFDTPVFTLPNGAWDRLRMADRLFYRAGSASTADDFDDYIVSTPDQRSVQAPFIALTGGRARRSPPRPLTARSTTS